MVGEILLIIMVGEISMIKDRQIIKKKYREILIIMDGEILIIIMGGFDLFVLSYFKI